ncbi:MAG: hypothetical protein ACE5HB_03130, partial [Terriglobia bacterium]
MAKGKRSSSYELVLEDRHLLGVFFAVVVLCALFFTLGFVLGRNQTTSQVASASAPQVEAPSEPPAAKPEELSFFDRLQGKPPAEKLPAATSKRSAPAPSKAPPKPSPAPAKQAQARASEARAAPLYLQVAAVTQQPDA